MTEEAGPHCREISNAVRAECLRQTECSAAARMPGLRATRPDVPCAGPVLFLVYGAPPMRVTTLCGCSAITSPPYSVVVTLLHASFSFPLSSVVNPKKCIPLQLQLLFARLQLTKERGAVSTTDLTNSFGWTSGQVFQQVVPRLPLPLLSSLRPMFKSCAASCLRRWRWLWRVHRQKAWSNSSTRSQTLRASYCKPPLVHLMWGAVVCCTNSRKHYRESSTTRSHALGVARRMGTLRSSRTSLCSLIRRLVPLT